MREPEIGAVQIGEAAEYGYKHGYVIEEYDGEYWSVPDWTERSQPHLEGVFNTRAAAEKAIAA